MTSEWRDTVTLDGQQRLVRDSIREISAEYADEYWRDRDISGEYPSDFVDTLADHDWLGILIPEEYGGVGMGTKEVVVMMEELAAEGGGFTAPQSIHGGIYNSVPLVRHASEDLKDEILPELASGESRLQSLGLTEPNAGSDSTSIETQAEKDGDEYVINGQKIWISRVDHSDYALVMARTTPKADVEKRTRGISMFLVDLEDAYDQDALKIQQIPKTASTAVHSFEMWFKDLRVPERNLVGVEGEGFYQLLDGLNEERLAIAAEALGLGFTALRSAVEYANEREVFDSPIGSNQAMQHPMAEAYARLRAAKQVTYSAAEVLDDVERTEAGARANTAKFLSADAAFDAADIAVQAHGGFGVAREYDVERYFREARLTRLVPITQELVLNYLGNSVLGLPRSY
ncbi:Acyl-CoA dehydrogenase [Halanaeroarchaeum sp. HSR-CO]|uniref:acyl-CoA dehydrogenase family protein n=1 Tax=Halanaeroarchaeum sp. HSR-CO TaxID=2866382 RepID=UPI00217E78C4|nr:acyl-CoA dehydrogenase family protein [Halanaeroarchaeum sp. HSR-CO]UWG46372.1 Acyl-CoA dehydrogenase [Halanaeroarchaeum sp. HSR-CO]